MKIKFHRYLGRDGFFSRSRSESNRPLIDDGDAASFLLRKKFKQNPQQR